MTGFIEDGLCQTDECINAEQERQDSHIFDPSFAVGIPRLTSEGSQSIEQFRPGDWVLSASEFDPEAPPEPRRVEEVFTHVMPLLHVQVGGQTIRTTTEHPFYVRSKGWVAAKDLQTGDSLRSHDGQWVSVESVAEGQGLAAVYNLRVADYHTYFVGGESWGFSVWAHNACDLDSLSRAAGAADRGGLTRAGRSLVKHTDRPGSPLPPVTGSPASINAQAQNIVDSILTHPLSTTSTRNHPRFGPILEFMEPGGTGLRFTASGDFLHFLGI